MTFRAHVRNGRLLLDEPTNLPEGTELELISIDEMTEGERQALEQALAESEEDVKAGRIYSSTEVLDELRRQ